MIGALRGVGYIGGRDGMRCVHIDTSIRDKKKRNSICMAFIVQRGG